MKKIFVTSFRFFYTVDYSFEVLTSTWIWSVYSCNICIAFSDLLFWSYINTNLHFVEDFSVIWFFWFFYCTDNANYIFYLICQFHQYVKGTQHTILSKYTKYMVWKKVFSWLYAETYSIIKKATLLKVKATSSKILSAFNPTCAMYITSTIRLDYGNE